MGKWTDSDTSKNTGDSSSKVAAAEHDARDHATKEGVSSVATVQKTASASVKATILAKQRQASGNQFLERNSSCLC